jgi:hypothetical protein
LFLQSKEPDSRYERVLDLDFSRCLKGIVQRWYERLNEGDKAVAFDMMREHLPLTELIAGIDRDVDAPAYRILSATANAQSLRVTRTAVKTIGVTTAKQPEKGSALLNTMQDWQRQGYEVVLFLTQQRKTWGESWFPTVYLPPEQECPLYGRPIKTRMETLDSALEHYEVDAFIMMGQQNRYFLGDFLLAKCKGLAVIVESFELTLKTARELPADVIRFGAYLLTLLQADGILACDEVSRETLAKYGVSCLDTSDYKKAFAQVIEHHERSPVEPLILSNMKREARERLGTFILNERTVRAFNLEAIWQQFKTSNFTGKIKILMQFLQRTTGISGKISRKEFNRYEELYNAVTVELSITKDDVDFEK